MKTVALSAFRVVIIVCVSRHFGGVPCCSGTVGAPCVGARELADGETVKLLIAFEAQGPAWHGRASGKGRLEHLGVRVHT